LQIYFGPIINLRLLIKLELRAKNVYSMKNKDFFGEAVYEQIINLEWINLA